LAALALSPLRLLKRELGRAVVALEASLRLARAAAVGRRFGHWADSTAARRWAALERLRHAQRYFDMAKKEKGLFYLMPYQSLFTSFDGTIQIFFRVITCVW
jgi:hypothetical protein